MYVQFYVFFFIVCDYYPITNIKMGIAPEVFYKVD